MAPPRMTRCYESFRSRRMNISIRLFHIFLLIAVTEIKLAQSLFGLCDIWEFKCDNKECIFYSKECDGKVDCTDGSDERGCSNKISKSSTTLTSARTTGHVQSQSPTVASFPPSTLKTISNKTVVFQCGSNSSRKEAEWYRGGYTYLPEHSYVDNGFLVLQNVKCDDAGEYICFYPNDTTVSDYYGIKLIVRPCRKTQTTQRYPSTEMTFSYTSLTTQAPYTNSTAGVSCCTLVCVKKNCRSTDDPVVDLFKCSGCAHTPMTSRCDGVEDCPDGFDERGCPPTKKQCRTDEFQCKNGTCIPVNQFCDNEIDCADGSDEIDCGDKFIPKITGLPQDYVEIDCSDGEERKTGLTELELHCSFAGNPVPIVRWKKYEGHVPAKCVQNSYDGHGIIRCPDFQQSDQGTYSCIAENLLGSAESQPKSVVKCSRVVCTDGFLVTDSHEIQTCLKCFCSGKDVKCSGMPSKPTEHRLQYPTEKMDLLVNANGEILIPNNSTIIPIGLKRVKYFSVPTFHLQGISFIRSYGRNMKIPFNHVETDFVPQAPDIVLKGNNLIISHSYSKISYKSEKIDVRFWKGSWNLNDGRIASRSDIMKVLSNLDMILLRCEYEESKTMHVYPGSEIIIQSSVVSDTSDSVSYLEKCSCPKGYSGLSCEVCAPGFERDLTQSDFICKPVILKPRFCALGEREHHCTCDKSKLHYLSRNKTCELAKCNKDGSMSVFPDDFDNCLCKEGVIGKYCDRCKAGYFYLNGLNSQGCKKCWCNNVSTKCDSSSFQVSSISSTSSGGYNSSIGENFWLLPEEFTGNKLASYGGYLRYSLSYKEGVAKQQVLSVEILSGNNVTLRYIGSGEGNDPKDSLKLVPIEEPFWRDENNLTVSREKLMQVLVQVQAIYIQSPYHLSSENVKLIRVTLDVADEMSNYAINDVHERAEKVEQCTCPAGYKGLSCESCEDGYYKMKTGIRSFICNKCDCQNCDPERGCSSCKKDEYQDNPDDLNNPVCRKCPCNGNQEYCFKDQLGQVMCFCKPGFSGIYCNISMSSSHLKVIISPLRVVNEEIGASIKFNCTYDSTDEMEIKFHKIYGIPHEKINDQDFKKIEITRFTSIMEIAIEEDLIAVECTVSDKNNVERGRVTAQIINTGKRKIKPQINCYNEAQKVIEDEDLELICEATGEPKPEITWYVMKDRKSVEVETINGVHSIASAKLDLNETIYLCIAENSAGDDKCTTQIFVKKRCDIISINPQNLIVYENETAQFICSTTSKAPVRWSYSRGRLPPEAEIYDGKLVIKKVTLGHGGKYVCTAHTANEVLEASAELTIIVKTIPPKAVIVEGDMVVKVGDTIVINCDVSGHPEPVVTWRKIESLSLPANMVKGNNSRQITLSKVDFKNQGFYECLAKSEIGTSTSIIRISVTDIPKVEINPKEVFAKPGESVNFDCNVLQGEPLDDIYWEYVDGTHFRRINGSKLRLAGVNFLNSNTYTCIAKNIFGVAKANARLFVGEKPSMTMFPEGETAAVVGDKFEIICNATGHPKPTIKWLQKLKSSDHRGDRNFIKLMNETGNKVTVTISRESDTIICEASNELGNANKTLKFSVQSGTTETSGTVQRVYLGERVEITFPELTDVVKCRRENSGLLGDECYITNGLEITSAQVQHRGLYICKSKTGKESRKKLIVVGFVQKFQKTRRSYLVLSHTVRSKDKFDAEITFKADNATGLLLQKREQHGFSMYLMNGKLIVKLRNYNSSFLVLESRQVLKLQVWYTAVFKLNENAELAIYDDKGVKMEFLSKPVHFRIDWSQSGKDDLYVGGAKFSGIHIPLRWHDLFFGGCISRLIVEDHEYQITKEGKYSRNVLLCNMCSSKIDPCGSEGICYNAPTQYGYVCACGKYESRCPQGCFGIGCQTKLSMCEVVKPCGQPENKCTYSGGKIECQCASGYSGLNCGNDERFEFSLDGSGYVHLPHYYMPRHAFHEAEIIKINFTSSSEEGILLYQRHKRNYLLIIVLKDGLFYVYENQGTTLSVFGDFESGPNHNAVITRRNSTVEMLLDGHSYTKKGPFKTNRVKGDIFIGGIPDGIDEDIPNELQKNYINTLKGFNGCIRGISLGKSDHPINVLAKDIKRLNFRRTCNQFFVGMKNDTSRESALSISEEENESTSDEDNDEYINSNEKFFKSSFSN